LRLADAALLVANVAIIDVLATNVDEGEIRLNNRFTFP
jgi:hypothetical protein